ncbi:MAG: hypothetical protein Terrestrivirus9_52 [Terrestrivirus sp.]|uniref:Uncharacterized protein n=1 Tax=Terrestrivirus sp. TaxID=2487775 RepID=A0A3G4ZP13_9VIRU|nr:MAG: hypothetical protein Terrestrivirus9_52 [Terrestrivirus sp.]
MFEASIENGKFVISYNRTQTQFIKTQITNVIRRKFGSKDECTKLINK